PSGGRSSGTIFWETSPTSAVVAMKKHLVPAFLVACTLLVAFWIVAGKNSAKPFKPFSLTAEDFDGFHPQAAGMILRAVPVSTNDASEPNVAAFMAEPEGSAIRLGIRLVHGYNMPMCMKIKGYTVEPIGDVGPDNRIPGLPAQFWRVISSTGETAIWITTMIRSGDFGVTPVDICSMAFPRVDVPDDPNWAPEGLGLADLKHPILSGRTYIRAKWNASRTDLLTFLRLRQPAWANDELLTYVSRSMPFPISRENEAGVIHQVLAGHAVLLKELQKWRAANQSQGEKLLPDRK
ncbi:MAG: hypothetical protein WCO42_10930, partial [bacterium]